MNFAIAVFGIMLIIALIFWVVKGRKAFLKIEDLSDDILYGQGEDDQPRAVDFSEKR
jgi:hypothetical protein